MSADFHHRRYYPRSARACFAKIAGRHVNISKDEFDRKMCEKLQLPAGTKSKDSWWRDGKFDWDKKSEVWVLDEEKYLAAPVEQIRLALTSMYFYTLWCTSV